MKPWRKALSVLGLLVLGLGGLWPTLSWGGVPAAQAGPGTRADSPPCYLLEDPAARFRMSAPFEEALLQLCGRAPAPAAPPASAWPPLHRGILLGPDVRVNAFDPPGSPSAVQSETSIAVNRNNGAICTAWNDRYHWYGQGNISYIGFARSTDGGQTFTDGGYMPPAGNGTARGDPSLVWRAADGYFYFTSIFLPTSGNMQLGFWRSIDDCASFQWVGLVHSGGYDDKEMMAVDNNPSSPYYGRFYIGWMDFYYGLSLTYSDNGTTWSTPVLLSSGDAQGAWPAVAPNGDVYVAWMLGTNEHAPFSIQVARSTNGGNSFALVANPASSKLFPHDAGATANCGRPALNGDIRYWPMPALVIGPDGCLHVVYSYDPDGHDVGDVVSAYYRRSCNHGASWETERRLNDDSTMTDQFFPALTVNANNVVAASWYDRRLDPGGNWYFDRYMALSLDGGVNWLPNQRVSDVSSPVWVDNLAAYCYHGDYDQMESTPGTIYVLWSDDRDFYGGHNDSDIYLDQEPLACELVHDAAFTWQPITPTVGQVVAFTGTATGTEPIAYSWQLDVGSWKTGKVVTYTYNMPGVYTVIMTATNCATATATVVHTVTVAACDPPTQVDFAWSPPAPSVGQPVTFTGTATGTLPITYSWNLGDGSLVFGPSSFTHTYTLPGVYTVTLTATNCATATATAVHTITVVQPCEPVHGVDFTWTPLTPTVGEQVTFTGAATGTQPITYDWKLDVGSWKQGAVVTYTYSAPGIYTVVMTATNCSTATASVTRTLTVLPPPCDPVHDVGLAFAPLTPTVGQAVAFTGTATGTLPIGYSWVFGDGGIGGGAHPTHTYASAGDYTVLLVATNCTTASVSVTRTVTVARPCEAVQIITVTQAVSGCVVTLGAELGGTAPFTYLWQAGLLTSTLPAPAFVFGASGTYTVTLAVSNCGGQDVAVVPVQVECPAPGWWVYLPVVFR